MTNQNNVGKRYADACLSKTEFPIEVIQKIIDWVKDPKGMLIFIGNPGVGKTYFCSALINSYIEKNKKTFYITESDFFRTLRATINEPGSDFAYKTKVMAGYEMIFILDDIGSNQMTEWQKEVLQLFLDERYDNKLPLVITSNIWLNDMKQVFSPRFHSRIAAKENVIIELRGEDKRQQGL